MMYCGFKNHAPAVFTTAMPAPCLRTASNYHHGFQLRHRERPATRQRLEREQEPRTVDDELGDNDRRRGNALKGEHQGNDTSLDQQPRAPPSRLTPCIQGFEVGVNCAAAAAGMALPAETSAQGHHVAAVARAFWSRRSSSNRRWLAHEIGQQPVDLFRPKSAKVL